LITNAYYGSLLGEQLRTPRASRERSLLVGPPAAAQLRGDTAEAAPLITPAMLRLGIATGHEGDDQPACRLGGAPHAQVLARLLGTQLDGGVAAADGYDLFTGNTLAEAHHEPAEANYGARPTPCARVVVERPTRCSHARGAAQVRGPLGCHLLQDPWIHSHIQIL